MHGAALGDNSEGSTVVGCSCGEGGMLIHRLVTLVTNWLPRSKKFLHLMDANLASSSVVF